MRFEQTVSEEGLSYLVIYNLSLVCYEIALILIKCLTNSMICNFKMTFGEILDKMTYGEILDDS